MGRIKKITAFMLILVFVFTAICGCSTENNSAAPTLAPTSAPTSAPTAAPEIKSDIDYSDKANWAYYAQGEGKEVDLFIICPTVDTGKNGNYNMSMDDEKMKNHFVVALDMEKGIYEETATMYSPFYRQMTFPVYSMTDEEMKPYLDIAYSDIRAAFEYYMQNINNGRPFILAGFSQGSHLMLMLLQDYFGNTAYSEKLVAAYCIGWRVTQDDITKYPHLKMAQGEGDTGVIISFNSEAEGVEESVVVPKGMKTLSINPLNWKTDSTPADKTMNKGACFLDYSATITNEIPHFTGAYIDAERGTLCLPDVDIEEYSNSAFPKGVYHLYDYQFFFRNLQENVALRASNYLADK